MTQNNIIHEELETITTIQYLGSKQRIVNEISKEILTFKDKTTLVDLFGGSGTISYALKDNMNIISNDIQLYSSIILSSILNKAVFSDAQRHTFFRKIDSEIEKLKEYIKTELELESKLLYEDSDYKEFQKFCNETPHVYNRNSQISNFSGLIKLCNSVVIGKKQEEQPFGEHILFLTYYSNTYFGIKQCLEIDAIRAAISKIEDKHLQNAMLSCLMSAMSIAVNSTTHFAQFLKIRDEKTAESISSKRKLSIKELFEKKVEYFVQKGIITNQKAETNFNHEVHNLDYLELLSTNKYINEDCVVYADPPYFKEHYSRYYHVLETLCLYDYPEITYNNRIGDITVGRYRDERSVSPFGKKNLAKKAFQELIESCAQKRAVLIISYSDNSLVSLEEIIENMEKEYYVQSRYIQLQHSKQGRSSTKLVNEVILIGELKDNKHDRNQIEIIKEIEPLFDNPCSAMHNYMARKPYNIVSEVIKAYTPKNGIVMDPFCGSGTTLIESKKLGLTNIGVDISKQAALITKTSLKHWDIDYIRTEITKGIKELSSRLMQFYRVQVDDEIRIVERCHFDLIDDELVPNSYWYKTINESGKSSKRTKSEAEQLFIENYNDFTLKYSTYYTDLKMLENKRIAVKEGATVADYFCSRNKAALSEILSFLKSMEVKEEYPIYELIVSSALNLIKLSDKKASSQIPFWRPKKDITSRNAAWIIESKAKTVLDGLEYLNDQALSDLRESFKELRVGDSLVFNMPIQDICEQHIPDSSIDLVFTDPPYTDQVPYLEYSQLCSLLLGWDSLESKNLDKEIIVSNAAIRKDKTIENFNNLMESMFKVVSSKLKSDGHFIMFYHDFTLKAWSSIIDSARKYGLNYIDQIPVDRQRRTFKTVLSPKSTLEGNYIVIFSKNKIPRRSLNDFDNPIERAKRVAYDIIIELNGKATSRDLYDKGMLKDAIENDYLKDIAAKHKTFVDVIKSDFEFDDGYWRINNVLVNESN